MNIVTCIYTIYKKPTQRMTFRVQNTWRTQVYPVRPIILSLTSPLFLVDIQKLSASAPKHCYV